MRADGLPGAAWLPEHRIPARWRAEERPGWRVSRGQVDVGVGTQGRFLSGACGKTTRDLLDMEVANESNTSAGAAE
jgi:hypothetical protein